MLEDAIVTTVLDQLMVEDCPAGIFDECLDRLIFATLAYAIAGSRVMALIDEIDETDGFLLDQILAFQPIHDS